MPRYRSFDVAFKRQVAEEFLTGESLNSLSRKYDVARNLIHIWVLKHEDGEFEPEFEHDNRLKAHEVKIVGLERMVGKLTMELEFLWGSLENTGVAQENLRAFAGRDRQRIDELIRQGPPNPEALKQIREEFPQHRTSAVQVRYRRGRVRLRHKDIPTSVEARHLRKARQSED